MSQLKLETEVEMKVGETIMVEGRKLIPIEEIHYAVNMERDNPYWFGVVEPKAILVIDSTGEYLLSLSKEITSLQEALTKVSGLAEVIRANRI